MIHRELNCQYEKLKLWGQEWKPETASKGVICLVHGLGEHTGRYEHVAEYLTGQGYIIMGYDLCGHGRSEGIRGHALSYSSLAGIVEHLTGEAKQCYPGLPRFIYGHSLGGAITLYTLLTRNVSEIKGAIVTSPGLVPAVMPAGLKMTAARIMNKIAPAFTMANDLDLNYLSHDPAVKDTYINDPLVHPKISARLGMELINNGAWIIEHASDLNTPLLLMGGSGDHIIDPVANHNFAAKLNPKLATYVEWDGLYHELHNEVEKEKVLSTIKNWLDQHL